MTPTLQCPHSSTDTNATGAYRIAWSGADGLSVRLEENGNLLYEGRQDATTVSGRAAGEYVYRIGVADSDEVSWSDSCSVTVAPPSLALALFLFGIGLTVFASVLVVVVRGHGAHKRGELQS